MTKRTRFYCVISSVILIITVQAMDVVAGSSATISVAPLDTLPTSFSWGNYQGHNWMTPIRSMEQCGTASVAFPIAGVYEARFRIQFGLPGFAIDLSEQQIISCFYGHCDGGTFSQALDSLASRGCASETCFPYAGSAVACSPCVNWTASAFRISSWRYQYKPSVDQIKREIYDHGPTIAVLAIYSDLFDYWKGVYIRQGGYFTGTGGIILYGWDDTQNCWLAKNQWGTGWGEVGPDGTHGWLRIRMGTNECGIEDWMFVLTTSCCVGKSGDVNMSGGVDLADLSLLVAYLTGGGYVLVCPAEANVNGSGSVDLADLSALVSYLTGGGYVLPSCP